MGSINLSEFVSHPFTEKANFDFELFENTVKQVTIAMNEVLDEGLPLHPLQEQRDSVRDWRQIGIGVMGIADMLIKMRLTYGSEKSICLCNGIGFNMINTAIQQSALLAKENGVYPMYNHEAIEKSEFFMWNTDDFTKDLVMKYGLRNSQFLTIAPTGTLSTMLGISGGIEPIYNVSYTRRTESLHGKDVEYKVYTPIVKEYMDKHGIKDEKELPSIFVTAMTLDYKDRIAVQSVWQNHIDASISSTVNVPNNFTVEQVENLYTEAWEKGLKGITIYRGGCARSGILTNDTPLIEEKESKDGIDISLNRGVILDTSDDLIGKKRKLQTGCGSLHILAYFDPDTGNLLETYLAKGSQGGCLNFTVGLSRMLSLNARAGVDVDTIVDQLNSSGTCPSYAVRRATKKDTSKGSCCPSAIGNALLEMQQEVWDELDIDKHIKSEAIIIQPKAKAIQTIKSKCPECGEELNFEGGCNSCPSCGFSKCS